MMNRPLYITSVLLCVFFAYSLAAIRFEGSKAVYDYKKKINNLQNATGYHENSVFSGDQVKHYQSDKYVEVRGKVKMNNKVEGVRFRANALNYYEVDERFIAWGKPYLKSEEDNLEIWSELMKGYNQQSLYKAFSNVRIKQKDKENDIELFGELANYYKNQDLLKVYTNAKAVTQSNISYSDVLHFYGEQNRLLLLGNAIVSNHGSESNVLTAQKVVYYGKNDNNSQEWFEAFTNVVLEQPSEATTIYAQYVKNYPDTDYTFVDGNPRLHYNSNSTIVYADQFERYSYSDNVYAKGNVKIVSSDSTSYASYCVMNLASDKATLYGNPYLEQDGSRIYSEKIHFYFNEERFQMENRIAGSFESFFQE